MKPTQILTRSSRICLRRTVLRPSSIRPAHFLRSSQALCPTSSTRSLSATAYSFKGLQPDTSDPKAPNTESVEPALSELEPAKLSDSEYHEIADQYMNTLTQVLEERAEDVGSGFDTEYSAGVLTLNTPSGTYIINKQPPNHQIWLSSPTSGPKRYDWVVIGGGQNTKEGTETDQGDNGMLGGGKWTYLRDGSTMTDLLKKEIDVDVAPADESDASLGKEGPGGSGANIL